MSNQLNDILYKTGEDIFENLAFVLTMPEDNVFGDFTCAGCGEEDAECDAELGNLENTPETECCGACEGCETDSFAGFDDLDDDMGESAGTIVASIHFSGEFEGDLFLEASCELLPVIGMNMLGLDDPDALSPDEQKDAFRELLNVICGNLMPAFAGEKAVFNIGGAKLRPEMTIPTTFESKHPLAKAHFGLEVGHAKLALFIDEKVWEEYKTATPSCV